MGPNSEVFCAAGRVFGLSSLLGKVKARHNLHPVSVGDCRKPLAWCGLGAKGGAALGFVDYFSNAAPVVFV